MRGSLQKAVFGALALSVLLQATVFIQTAESCWFMRLTEAERPVCCALGSKDRVTPEGGDCCKSVWLNADRPAGSTSSPEVPAAFVAFIPQAQLIAVADRGPIADHDAFSPFIARPPPIPIGTENVVLLN